MCILTAAIILISNETLFSYLTNQIQSILVCHQLNLAFLIINRTYRAN